MVRGKMLKINIIVNFPSRMSLKPFTNKILLDNVIDLLEFFIQKMCLVGG